MAKGKAKGRKSDADNMSNKEFDAFLENLSQVTGENSALHQGPAQKQKKKKGGARRGQQPQPRAEPETAPDEGMMQRLWDAIRSMNAQEEAQDGQAPVEGDVKANSEGGSLVHVEAQPEAKEGEELKEEVAEAVAPKPAAAPKPEVDEKLETTLQEVSSAGNERDWALFLPDKPVRLIASGGGGVAAMLPQVPHTEVAYAIVRHEMKTGSLTVAKRVCLLFSGNNDVAATKRYRGMAMREEITAALRAQMTILVDPEWDVTKVQQELERVCEGAAVAGQ